MYELSVEKLVDQKTAGLSGWGGSTRMSFELCKRAACATRITLPVDFALFGGLLRSPFCFSLHDLFLSFIDVCLVLFCSAPPSLLLLHPVWAACTWVLFFGGGFSAVPVPPPPGVNIEEHIQIRQEEKRQRINRRHRLEEGRGMNRG